MSDFFIHKVLLASILKEMSMNTDLFKQSFLALSIAVASLSITACNNNDNEQTTQSQQQKVNTAPVFASLKTMKDGFTNDTAKKTYVSDIKSKVAPAAQEEVATWLKELFDNKNVTAANGVAGKLPRKNKYIVVNKNAFEYAQLIKKSLIGAYQFNGAVNEYKQLMKSGANNQLVLENVTGYLLGDYSELAKGKGKSAYPGNEFEKYLKRVSQDPDFSNLEDDLYAALNAAKNNTNNDAVFKENIKKALVTAQKAIGVRTVFYLNIGADLLMKQDKFSTAAHATTEGLGFLHGFQFTHNPATQKPYYTKAEVDAFLSGLNLWDKQTAYTKLKAESKEVAKRFGISYEAAIKTKQKDQVAVFASIKKIQGGFANDTAKNEYANTVKAKVAGNAQANISTWINDALKYKGAMAAKGVAGKLARTQKNGKARYIVVNPKAFEYSQLVKKGLIGAYQLDSANKEIKQLSSGTSNAQVLTNVTAYLLGDYEELAKGKGKSYYAGNEFEKYLKKVASNQNFSSIEDDLYAALNAAKANEKDNAKFKQEITKAVATAEKAVAVRAAHYLYTGAQKLESTEAGVFGNSAHAVSEGLGLLYSLQYAINPKTKQPYATKADIDAFLAGLDLWNKADAKQKLMNKAKDVAGAFGFDVTKA